MNWRLLIASALMTAVTGAAAAPGNCQLATIAEWPLRPGTYLPIIDGAINGQKVGVLVDTGSYTSFVRGSAATKLGLEMAAGLASDEIYGVLGSRRVQGALIRELRVGDAVRRDWLATVTAETQLGGDVAVVLGYEFFRQMDVELDLARNVIRLFQPQDCDGAALAYWTKDALEVPLEHGRRLQFMVTVNGKRLVAELDTGASTNVMSMEGATTLGISPESPGVTPASCIGAAKDGLESWTTPLESFEVGGERIRNAHIRFADLWRRMVYYHTSSNLPRRLANMADVLLGVDFLRAHRIYIAHSQRKLYFSYTGGTIFPVRAGKPCNSAPN